MSELSVVGPASTSSSVCTHCLSEACDQHSGYKEVGTLLNSQVQGLLGEAISTRGLQKRDTSDSHSQHTQVTCQLSL